LHEVGKYQNLRIDKKTKMCMI